MRIRSASGGYQVRVAPGLLDSLIAPGAGRVIVADERFADRLHGAPAVLLRASEDAKTMAGAERVIAALRKLGCYRGSTLIAIGGGVVQDVVAFAASVYMRGIPWIYAPTTLLAMADSCIGGKSSINVAGHKNLVGTVHAPAQVLIDPTLARTLDVKQRVAGLCEAAKICFARGPRAFDRYIAMRVAPHCDEEELGRVIALSLVSKKWFIEIDEFDRNERLLLNFGHTFGHAIEDASQFAVGHGVAVGLGMLVAFRFVELEAGQLGPRAEQLRDHLVALLRCVPDLGQAIGGLVAERLLQAFEADKKHRSDSYAVIMPDRDDRLERRFHPRNGNTRTQIAQSYSDVLGSSGW